MGGTTQEMSENGQFCVRALVLAWVSMGVAEGEIIEGLLEPPVCIWVGMAMN